MDVRRRISYNMNTGSGESTTTGTYTINLNNQWQKSSTITNPDATLYDGVYESFSNKGVNNTAATMTITINGYSNFTLYIRSYAESNWDYVMVSQLDQTINNNTSYSNTTLVKAHTRGNQQSGTAVSNYTEVIFDNIDGNEHVITIVYRKDGSSHSSDDRGYLFISKNGNSDEPDTPESTGPIDINDYLTILALEDGLTASLTTNACQYCIDGDGTWHDLAAGSTTSTINSGQTLSFKGMLTPTTSDGIGTFTITKTCNLLGNCMSMLFGDTASSNNSLSGKRYTFYKLFYNCSTIIDVSETFLPATTLGDSCYSCMFSNCSSLTTAPELPATILYSSCYSNMFSGCSNLTTSPELPATTLYGSCYSNMFSGCTGLLSAPELPAITLAYYCYEDMFYNCTSLTTPPELPATTLANYCYNNMFYGCVNLTIAPIELPAIKLVDNCYLSMFSNCSSLTTAPELPATTLADNCYKNMFKNCSNLTIAPALPATTLANQCYEYMFYGCTSLTTAPALPAITLTNQCYNYMFYGCTSLTTAPELPATTLANYCYGSMFRSCSNLITAPVLPAATLVPYCYNAMFYSSRKINYIKMLATDVSASYCLGNWVIGVASTGTFVKDPSMTTLPTGSSGIPKGWTVVDNES